MSLPGPDPVERWRRPERTPIGSPLPVLLGVWGLVLAGSLLPAPWAPLLWWALAAPFAMLLRRVLHPAEHLDQARIRTVALALALLEAGAWLLGLWLLGAVLDALGLPGARGIALILGLVVWSALGAGHAGRPVQALTAALPGMDAVAAWLHWRRTPPLPRSGLSGWFDGLALAGWILLPWLLTLPELRGHLPLAPFAYAALLFPALALWLVDRPGATALPVPSVAMSAIPVAAAPESIETDAPDPLADPGLQLVAAVRRGDLGHAHHWLDAGASPDAAPPEGAPDPRNALQSAVAAGSLDLVQMLLRAGATVDRQVRGRTALEEALRGEQGHPEIVRALLKAGADPERAEAGAEAQRPLHLAARHGDPGMAQLLIEAGATLDAIGAGGLTALGVALQSGRQAMAVFLLDAGASLEPAGAVPALHAAVIGAEDSLEGLQLLELRRADFTLRDGAGQTALMLAAAANHPAQVAALAARGCPVDAVDARGRTALMLAAAVGANRGLHALARLSASAGVVDDEGNTALHLAVAGDAADLETVELLLGLGVPIHWRNDQGLSAEELAYSAGRSALARLLRADGDLPAPAESGLGARMDLPPPDSGPLDRGDRLIQACAQHRFDLAHSLIRQGPLPQGVWVEALLAAGDRLEAGLLEALRGAGLRVDALAHPSPQLSLARRLPCPAGPLQLLMDAGASVDAAEGGETLLGLICGRAEALAGVATGPAPPLTLLQTVLAAAPPLGHRGPDGQLPLHLAIHHRPLAWIEALLQAGADPNATDLGGRSALHHAVVALRPDREALLRTLILAGGDPAQPASDGSTVQGLAVMAGEASLARCCDFRTGEHPRHRLRPEDVPQAARSRQVRLLARLIELGLPVDARDERQATALIHAAGQGETELVAQLLAWGAQWSLRSDHGVDALAAAVLGGQQATVSLLLDRGATVNGEYAGLSPMALAAGRADPGMVELLLQRGGHVQSGSAERSPLTLAIRAASQRPDPAPAFACIDALLARRARVDLLDAEGRTLLLWLCGSGANAPVLPEGPVLLALIGRLLAAGADVNAVDQYQRNAAHWACRHHQPQVLALLLRHGVDTLKPDDMRRLPIDLVASRRRPEFLEVLQA